MSSEPPAAPATPHILRRPVAAVVFWDFDGTVYRSPAGCRRYGEEIARSLPRGQRGEYLASLDQYLSGQGGIDAADGWEAAVELAARYLVAGNGNGDDGGDDGYGHGDNGDNGGGGGRPPAGQRFGSSAGEDRAAAAARPQSETPLGPAVVGPSRFHEEFRRAREYMESGDCPLEVPKGLPEAISRMRPVSRHILVTNTPAFGVYRLLGRLGVAACFDEVVCEAAKPTLLPARLSATATVYGLDMTSVLCVGDHFDNDVAPALAAGAAGAYVNAYRAGPAGAADFEGPVLEAILSDIERWVSVAGARRPAKRRAPAPLGGKEHT
jgi:phosphoglycolate phosphatase-like HAD superfamily hydrolase